MRLLKVGTAMGRKFQQTLESILKDDRRYAVGAYVFVRMALDYTVKKVNESDVGRKDRNVSGRELLEGIREFALDTFGPMSMPLLDEWGVSKCEDFGNIVFNLVEAKALTKTEEDRIEDFMGGYDFDEAFVKPFLPACALKQKGKVL